MTARPASAPRTLVVLGHGAGGGIDAVDLTAVTDALVRAGHAVALVVQPYRVAGRRAPAPAAQLDVAWIAVCAELRSLPGFGAPVPLVVGGRSSGARVACRTAAASGAAAVLALAFPLHPPARPEASRRAELTAVRCPLVVLQGDRDAFGAPAEFPPGLDVRPIPGADHTLRRDPDAVAGAALDALARLFP